MSSHSQTSVTLSPDDEFSLYSEPSYSGSLSDQYGCDAGSWGTAGSQETRGRWTASGTREKGVFTLVYEGGQAYWNEYYIDGTLTAGHVE